MMLGELLNSAPAAEWTIEQRQACLKQEIEEIEKALEFHEPDEAENILKGYSIAMSYALDLIWLTASFNSLIKKP